MQALLNLQNIGQKVSYHSDFHRCNFYNLRDYVDHMKFCSHVLEPSCGPPNTLEQELTFNQ